MARNDHTVAQEFCGSPGLSHLSGQGAEARAGPRVPITPSSTLLFLPQKCTDSHFYREATPGELTIYSSFLLFRKPTFSETQQQFWG